MNNYDLFSLAGKNIVVTGGTGHLGTAICEGLANCGANVMIVSRNEEKCRDLASQLNLKYNVNCQGYEMDISDSHSISHTFEKIVSYSHTIDVLVNNAYYGASGSIEQMTEQEWVLGIDGTINSVFRTTKVALPYMLLQNQGNIINISSMYGVVSPDPSIYGDSGFNSPPNYGAGKAAVLQFTRYIACHYGVKGIRANCISPGPFPDERVQQNKEFVQNLIKKTALGRIGKPADLQGVVVFLASNASSYVTGQNICVDGGWTSW